MLCQFSVLNSGKGANWSSSSSPSSSSVSADSTGCGTSITSAPCESSYVYASSKYGGGISSFMCGYSSGSGAVWTFATGNVSAVSCICAVFVWGVSSDTWLGISSQGGTSACCWADWIVSSDGLSTVSCLLRTASFSTAGAAIGSDFGSWKGFFSASAFWWSECKSVCSIWLCVSQPEAANGANASMRKSVITKPAYSSGASGKSCLPWIAHW